MKTKYLIMNGSWFSSFLLLLFIIYLVGSQMFVDWMPWDLKVKQVILSDF